MSPRTRPWLGWVVIDQRDQPASSVTRTRREAISDFSIFHGWPSCRRRGYRVVKVVCAIFTDQEQLR